jgi:hypothetical protein
VNTEIPDDARHCCHVAEGPSEKLLPALLG